MEDLEYLPSFEAAACFRGEKLPKSEVNVKGKVLTDNIVILTECIEDECGFKGEMTIDELKSYPEPYCPICLNGLSMRESIIKN